MMKGKKSQLARAVLRKQRRAKMLSARTSDAGTPELALKHRLADDITVVDGIEAPVKRVMTQRPIDTYLLKNHITKRQWIAADRISTLSYHCGFRPRVTHRYDITPTGPSTGDDAVSRMDDARKKYREAMLVLGISTRTASCVVAVCVNDETAANWAANNGVYRGQNAVIEGMTTLRLALDRLVGFWRIK